MESSFKGHQAECESTAGDAGNICMAEANGNEKVAEPELDASCMPINQARYDA